MNKIPFEDYALYYDLIYQDKNYELETGYVNSLIKKYGGDVYSVLEIGTGTGKQSKYFTDLGYVTTGIEKSDLMASIARRNNINCFTSDAVDFNLGSKFDCSISLFHVISYLTSNEQIILAFKNISRHLKENGIFIFDVWYTPAVYNLKPEKRIKKVENGELIIIRRATPTMRYNENIVDVNYEITIENKVDGKEKKINEVHSMRHFSINEIKLIAEFTGFEFITGEEWLWGNAPSENTWSVCFVLRKVQEKDKDEVE